jgi:hypothetical protein
MTTSFELSARQRSRRTEPSHGQISIANSIAIKAEVVVGEITRHRGLDADSLGATANLFSSAGSCGEPRANNDCRSHSQPLLRLQATTTQTGEY